FLRLANMVACAERRQAAVATGPVRTAQTRIGKAHEGAEHLQIKRQEQCQKHQGAITFPNPCRMSGCRALRHRHPTCEANSSLPMSRRNLVGSAFSGNCIIRLLRGSMTQM